MVDDMTLPPSERRNRDGPGAEPPQRLHGIASLPPNEESPRAYLLDLPCWKKRVFSAFQKSRGPEHPCDLAPKKWSLFDSL